MSSTSAIARIHHIVSRGVMSLAAVAIVGTAVLGGPEVPRYFELSMAVGVTVAIGVVAVLALAWMSRNLRAVFDQELEDVLAAAAPPVPLPHTVPPRPPPQPKGIDRHAVEALRGEIAKLGDSSSELSRIGDSLGAGAEQTSRQAEAAARAAEHAGRNVQTVATGTEEMSVTIREIAKNATEAAKVAAGAAANARRTNELIGRLGDSSQQVGNVIKVITAIADQTNLLALNATIEAARAGDAGKGFAVVANEVKELAKETARATEDISAKIESMQGDTRAAVEAIGAITNVIGRIDEIQTAIATSVEQQAATTNEIGRTLHDLAESSNEIAQTITAVAGGASATASAATRTRSAAQVLTELAAELSTRVGELPTRSGVTSVRIPVIDATALDAHRDGRPLS